MFKRISLTALVVVAFAIAAQAQTWSVDHAHSKISFTVKHLVLTNVYGQFKDFEGTVAFDGTNVDKASADFTIQATSINTDNEKRDGHLRSADFFEVEKYPTITFKSKKIIKGEGSKFQLVGDLTIKDVTKEVTFECEFAGILPGKDGADKAGFSAHTTINRQDYHVSWSRALDNGGLVAGDDIKIAVDLELNKKVEEAAKQ